MTGLILMLFCQKRSIAFVQSNIMIALSIVFFKLQNTWNVNSQNTFRGTLARAGPIMVGK